MADRAWQQHPSAVAGPGPASRRRTKPTSKPRDGPRSDRAWQQHPSAVARPGPASRSTTPSPQARVWRSRGRAAAHGRIKQPGPTAGSNNTWNTSYTRNTSGPLPPPTDTAHRCHPRAHQAARPHRHAPPGTRPETRPEHQRPHKHTPEATESGPEPLGSGPPSILSDYRRHAPGGATRQVVPRDR